MKAILTGVLLSTFILSAAAAIPHDLPLSPSFHELSKESQRQVTCLAENIYFEAASESVNGKLAVAFVTINRVLSYKFPSTICNVVHQKQNGVCQFSWLCDPSALKQRAAIKQTSLYREIVDFSIIVLLYHELIDDVTKGATYFHSIRVNPRWRLYKTAQIGNHIFYRQGKDRYEVSTSRRIHIH